MKRAGFATSPAGALEVSVDYSGFEDFWEPFTFAVGPSGQAFAKLGDEDKVAVREAIRAELPDGPFRLDARAWYATAICLGDAGGEADRPEVEAGRRAAG